METQPLVTIVPWTFIAQILNLFIQVYLIKRFLFKPINEMLEKRQKLATKELDDARASKEAADALKEDYEHRIEKAHDEAAAIVSSAQKEAELRSDEMLADTQAQIVNMKSKAEADIEHEKKKAINEVKDEIGGIAMDIAGKVVEKEINEEDHRRLIDSFIENVGEAS